MQTVYLNGGISQFGTKWSTNCANIRDIFKLIDCQTPGFRQYLVSAAENNVDFEIKRGEDILESGEELLLSLRDEDIVITEVPAGAKDGAGKVLAAIAIFTVIGLTGGTGGFFTNIQASMGFGSATSGAATTFGYRAAAMIAVNLASAGVSQLMMPGPEMDGTDINDNYLFDGPVTNAPEGMAIPVLYGELIVGGRPVSVNYQEHSPFSYLNDIHITDTYVDFITGAVNSTTAIPAVQTDTGEGVLPPVDDQGIPDEPAPTTQPDPRDDEYYNRNENEEGIEQGYPTRGRG
tara:strand:- start:687 stop:1559 length:873 start_codon:yes stop_codon:yes gene_type:complete